MDKSLQKETSGEDFERYRKLLFALAYRMTGSASEAEDIVQEAYLRYQGGAEQEVVSLKAYLSTIVTRLSLDYLKSARVEREQYIGQWLPEPVLTSAPAGIPPETLEQQESISLAFLLLLEILSPPERAVFLLREVFDYPFHEIGEIIDKSPANCRQIFHRARQAISQRRVRFASSPQRQQQLMASFISACQAGDVPTLTNLLAQDAVSWSDGGGKVRAALNPIYGQHAIARLWTALAQKNQQGFSLVLEEVNGSTALLIWEDLSLIIVFTFMATEAGIQKIYAIMNPDKLAYIQRQVAARYNSSPIISPES